uniref:Uncharacterized protein n=1 Tax=Glossina austeni TaxID=7395 RepID=A0A1A9UN56_GLOAU
MGSNQRVLEQRTKRYMRQGDIPSHTTHELEQSNCLRILSGRNGRTIGEGFKAHECDTIRRLPLESQIKFDSSSIIINTVNVHTRGSIYVRKRRDNDQDDVKWSIINEEVDTVVPLVLQHLKKMRVEHLLLPDIKENISVVCRFPLSALMSHIKFTGIISDALSPYIQHWNLFNKRHRLQPGRYKSNLITAIDGIEDLKNVLGINRFGQAYMTYENGAFLVRFYLNVRNLQFEYEFLLKLLALEGHGKVIGSLEDTLVYMDLGIDVKSLKIVVYDFRVVNFRNIQVQLNEARFIRDLSGFILTPLTKLFKESITTSISDNLKEQMQMVMDDFNNGDPLELQKFVKQVLGGLTGNQNHTQ